LLDRRDFGAPRDLFVGIVVWTFKGRSVAPARFCRALPRCRRIQQVFIPASLYSAKPLF
jgi:hypothetical protein